MKMKSSWILATVTTLALALPAQAALLTLDYRYVAQGGDALTGGFFLRANTDNALDWGAGRSVLNGHIGVTTFLGAGGGELDSRNVQVYPFLPFQAGAGAGPQLFPVDARTGAFTQAGFFTLSGEAGLDLWTADVTFAQAGAASWSGSNARGQSGGGFGHWDITVTGWPAAVTAETPEPASVVLLGAGLAGAGLWRRRVLGT
jgi:hypothetical protein